MHTPNKPNTRKTNATQKTPNTAHCRQSVKQTAQRAEKVVEHTVLDKIRSGALNVMRSTQWETKTHVKSSEQRATKRRRYGREVERATRDVTETGQTRSRASSARRNGNGTCGKASEKRATQRDGTVGTNGREMKTERTMLADHSENSTKQPSRNSRTNLSHTLGRRREATARQSNIVHYGGYNDKFNDKLIYGNAVVHWMNEKVQKFTSRNSRINLSHILAKPKPKQTAY